VINLYRRLDKDCKNKTRDVKKCLCPINIDWFIEGKRIRKSLGIRDWQAAQQRVRQMEAVGLSAEKSHIQIDKALDAFQKEIRVTRTLKPATLRKYEYLFRLIREFCKPRGLVFLNQLGVQECRDFRDGWDVGPNTHRVRLEQVKCWFNFCVDSEWLTSSPVKSFKPPKGGGKEPVPFTEAQVVLIYSACDKYEIEYERLCTRKKLRALIELMLATGLRIGDATMFQKAGITKDGDEYTFPLRTTKTGQRVTMPVKPLVAETLLKLDGDYPFWNGVSDAETTAVTWRRALMKVFKLAGITGTPHPVQAYVCQAAADEERAGGRRQSPAGTPPPNNHRRELFTLDSREASTFGRSC